MSALPRGSLASFLSTARTTLHSAIISQQRVTIVIGINPLNLDSIISSILFAYLKTSAPANTPLTNTSVNKHQPPNKYPPFYIPIVNGSREALRDLPGLEAILSHAQLTTEHLMTLDDLDVEPPAGLNPDDISTLRPQSTRLVVMGDRVLSGRLSSDFDTCVDGHINHTSSQSENTTTRTSEDRVDLAAGTCTSLTIDQCRSSWDLLTTGGGTSAIGSAQDDSIVGVDDSIVRRKWDAQIAKLAMAVILQGTNNLQNKEVTTQYDSDACEYLDAKIALADVSWDRNVFFDAIR